MFLVAAVVLLGAALVGRGARPSGTYTSANGDLTIEFTARKAMLTIPDGTAEADDRVGGDRVILSHGGRSVILTRNDDGSLDGLMARMTQQNR